MNGAGKIFITGGRIPDAPGKTSIARINIEEYSFGANIARE